MEWVGYHCVDEYEYVPGTAGSDPVLEILLEVGRNDIWPVEPVENEWSADAIVDFLQFIGQKVSGAVIETG